MPVISSIGDLFSFRKEAMFNAELTNLMAYGHKWEEMASGHLLWA